MVSNLDITINSDFAIIDSPKLHLEITRNKKRQYAIDAHFLGRAYNGDNTFFNAIVPVNVHNFKVDLDDITRHMMVKHFAPISVNMSVSKLRSNNFKIYIDKAFNEYVNYAIEMLKAFFASTEYKKSNWYLSPEERQLLLDKRKYQKVVNEATAHLHNINDKLHIHTNENFYTA